MGPILIVDDKVNLCESLVKNFVQRGHSALYAVNSREALDILAQNRVEAVLLDIMLGQENGIDLLTKIQNQHNNIPVIMITGFASIDSAVESLKLGAYDYIQKPLEFEKLLNVVEKATRYSRLNEENQVLKDRLSEAAPRIVTQNQDFLALLKRAKKLAATDLPVLISGANGTGKEILADYIHSHSARGARRMLKVNCAAFAESLLDNELFGHQKGAYTGADSNFKGVFERADHSSLFLDEIGDMPRSIQAKILRTLQNKEIRRLGSEKTLTIDVRFITATNKNLERKVETGQFREDLYYRLNAAVVHIPPLKDRKEDIPLLVNAFLNEHAGTHGVPPKTLHADALDRLLNHDWPGNVRELKNAVFYAAAMSSASAIYVDDLPPNFMGGKRPENTENIREEIERDLIIKMLQKTNNNKKKTAQLLNFSRRTLYNKLKKYGLSY